MNEIKDSLIITFLLVVFGAFCIWGGMLLLNRRADAIDITKDPKYIELQSKLDDTIRKSEQRIKEITELYGRSVVAVSSTNKIMGEQVSIIGRNAIEILEVLEEVRTKQQIVENVDDSFGDNNN